MAWDLFGPEPLPEPIMTQQTRDKYMPHQTPVS